MNPLTHRRAVISLAFYLLFPISVTANGWSTVSTPTRGATQIFGQTNNGCIAGAQALPTEGDGYRVVHLERNRYYGHPLLVEALQTLAQQARQNQISTLQIGDLGQARGGPMPSGHRSHQTGLDADIWFNLDPAVYANTNALRSNFAAPSMLNSNKKGLNTRLWSDKHVKLLELTARLPEIDRVFVNPYIKRDLCDRTLGERHWLRKIRPWYHHDDHFHIRLACPSDSPGCQKQEPIPAGEGCGAELDWWFAEHPAIAAPISEKPPLPAACEAVLNSP